MELVHEGNAEGWQHEEKKKVTQNKVGREVTQFGDLTQELTARLRDGVPTHAVPFSSPPGDVGLIVLELTSQCQANYQLVDEPLNGNHGNHAENTTRPGPSLKEEHNLENGKQDDDSNSVGDGSENGTELLAAHAEERTHTTGHTEEGTRHTSVDTNRTECNDGNTQDRVRLVFIVCCLLNTGSGVDVKVRDNADTDQDQRDENFAVEDVGNARPWHVTSAFLRRNTEQLTLITGDTGTG